MTSLEIAVKDTRTQTSLNDHTGALITMAYYVSKGKQTPLVVALEAIETLQAFYGELTPELSGIRAELSARVFSALDPMEKTVFFNCI